MLTTENWAIVLSLGKKKKNIKFTPEFSFSEDFLNSL